MNHLIDSYYYYCLPSKVTTRVSSSLFSTPSVCNVRKHNPKWMSHQSNVTMRHTSITSHADTLWMSNLHMMLSLTKTFKVFSIASSPNPWSISKSRILMGIALATMGITEKVTNCDDCGSKLMVTYDVVVAEPGAQRPSVCSMFTATYKINAGVYIVKACLFVYIRFFKL